MDTGDARLIGKALGRTVGGAEAVSSTDAREGATRRLNPGEEATPVCDCCHGAGRSIVTGWACMKCRGLGKADKAAARKGAVAGLIGIIV
jgi:DnaJ-class molecular chaperone